MVTVSLELSGPEASIPFIEAARPRHPSLLDSEHRMESLFGVVNIPSVMWIDEDGVIVRPPEPGWPGPTQLPESLTRLAQKAEQRAGGETGEPARSLMDTIAGGQDRSAYAGALRDWVERGPDSPYRLSPEEVVARSRPRPMAASEAAAHFELGSHLWRLGERDAAIHHFNAAHRLEPDNWSYKRQAWSLVGNEQAGGGELGRFNQGPLPGQEDSWPFDSDFRTDVLELEPGQYYPKTL